MTNGLLAVRRGTQPNIVQYRQTVNLVEYSLDGVNWLPMFLLPPNQTNGYAKGGDWYQNEKTIENYTKNYYQDTNIFDLLISLLTLPTTRTEAVARAKELGSIAPSNKVICSASLALAESLRTSINLAKKQELGESKAVDTANIGAGIVAGLSGIAGLFIGSTPIGWGLMATAVATAIAKDLLLPATLETLPDISDEDLLGLACCIYNGMRGGAKSYDDFTALECNFGTDWDNLVSPELYAGFLAMTQSGENVGICPCEDCITLSAIDGTVLNGAVYENLVFTTPYNTGGNVFEQQARVTYPIPSMVISEIKVVVGTFPYENVATPTPMISFNSAGTGGGNTTIPTVGSAVITLNPAYFSLNYVTEFTLNLRVSTCATCTASQTASFNQSYGYIYEIQVCGALA